MNKEKEKPAGELALLKVDIVSIVTKRINELVGEGKLPLPQDYSAENALMAAWLKIQATKDKAEKPALSVCTKDSVANAVLDMIVLGLTPAKDQCYFIVYGNKLVMRRSYFGDVALLCRVYPGARVFAEPVYKGDDFEYDINLGRKIITKHKQKLANIGGLDTIALAYAVVDLGKDHEGHTEIMTIAQIEKAWSRGQNWPSREGKMSAHRDHPEEFVKKTVIARACKLLINASNDSYLVRASERQAHLAIEAEMEERIEEEGNKEIIDLPPEEDRAPDPTPTPDKNRDPEIIKHPPAEAQEESPDSPSARFLDLIEAHELNPTKARKLAASIRNLKDVRNLGNDDYAAILANTQDFLVCYGKEYKSSSKASQGKLDGPGF